MIAVAVGRLVFVIVAGALAAAHVVAPQPSPADPPKPETFQCWNCDTGPWARGWDPIEGGMTSYKRAKAGFGLCPNCSGAD